MVIYISLNFYIFIYLRNFIVNKRISTNSRNIGHKKCQSLTIAKETLKKIEKLKESNTQNIPKPKTSNKPNKVQISESTLDEFLKSPQNLAQTPRQHKRRGSQFTLQKTTKSSFANHFANPFKMARLESPVPKKSASKFNIKEPIRTPNIKTNAKYDTVESVVNTQLTPNNTAKKHYSDKRSTSRNGISNIVQKYKPSSSSLLTPVRKSARNKSISGLKSSSHN
jgi:hypothetical protein